jgi:hypothetical protein
MDEESKAMLADIDADDEALAEKYDLLVNVRMVVTADLRLLMRVRSDPLLDIKDQLHAMGGAFMHLVGSAVMPEEDDSIN